MTAYESLVFHMGPPRQVLAQPFSQVEYLQTFAHSFNHVFRAPVPPHCGQPWCGSRVPLGWLMRLDTVHVNLTPRPHSPP